MYVGCGGATPAGAAGIDALINCMRPGSAVGRAVRRSWGDACERGIGQFVPFIGRIGCCGKAVDEAGTGDPVRSGIGNPAEGKVGPLAGTAAPVAGGATPLVGAVVSWLGPE